MIVKWDVIIIKYSVTPAQSLYMKSSWYLRPVIYSRNPVLLHDYWIREKANNS